MDPQAEGSSQYRRVHLPPRSEYRFELEPHEKLSIRLVQGRTQSGEEPDAESSAHRCRDDTEDFQDRGVAIETLVLDFQSAELELSFPPEDVSYKHWRWWHCGRDMRSPSAGLEPLSSYKTRPQWLCQYLRMEIGGLLQLGYHTARYGQPLYEHIGTIRMLVDGQLVDELDLAAWLARLHFTDPEDTMGHLVREQRLSSLEEWKRETWSLRKERGLPVIWPSDDDENN